MRCLPPAVLVFALLVALLLPLGSSAEPGSPPTASAAECPGTIKLGSRTYIFYRQRARCKPARRAVRRLYKSRGKKGRPRGYRCTSGSNFRQGGNCTSRSGTKTFGWHPGD